MIHQETAEMETIRAYLPPKLPPEVIVDRVRAKMKELNIKDKKDIGKLTGAVMKDLKSQADGAVVKMIVERLLS